MWRLRSVGCRNVNNYKTYEGNNDYKEKRYRVRKAPINKWPFSQSLTPKLQLKWEITL